MQRFTFLLLSLVVLGPLGIDLYLPTLPDIATELSISVSTVNTTIPLFLLVIGLGQIIAGPLVDNFGRKPIAMIGLFLYIFGSAMAGISMNWPMFLLARLIQGCAVCCTSVVVFSGVRDRLSGEEAAQVYSFLNGALNIVPTIAPILGTILAKTFGWRTPFWFLVFYALFISILIAILFPETRPSDTKKIKGLSLRQYIIILFQPRFLAFTLVNASTMGMVLTYVSLAPRVLMTESHLNSFQFSVVFGANGLLIMLVSILVNKIIRKENRPFCLLIGIIAMLSGATLLFACEKFIPIYLQTHWIFYMLPAAISIIGLTFTVGPATSYALEPYQKQAGIASALAGFVQMVGGSSSSLLMMALPITGKHALALTMLSGASLTFLAWYYSKRY